MERLVCADAMGQKSLTFPGPEEAGPGILALHLEWSLRRHPVCSTEETDPFQETVVYRGPLSHGLHSAVTKPGSYEVRLRHPGPNASRALVTTGRERRRRERRPKSASEKGK